MTVRNNVAFGPRVAGASRREARLTEPAGTTTQESRPKAPIGVSVTLLGGFCVAVHTESREG